MVPAMPPTARIRDHAGQGATTVAAHRTRRRLRVDRARQLADLLRRQLLDDAFPNGTLPHEDILAADYDTTRNTVRQALDLLRAEGLVARRPGIGTVVVARKYDHGLDRLMGLAETLHEHGRVTNEVRTTVPVPAPAPVAERLRVPHGADVLYIERLRRLNGVPLSLDLTYLPLDIGTALLGADLENTDVFRLLESVTGRPLGHAEITLEGRHRRRALRRRTGGTARHGGPHAGTAHPPRRRPPRRPGVRPLPRRPHRDERPAAPVPVTC
ncbi:GntR family transcriptional regulator [Streptomyces ambofaciens]